MSNITTKVFRFKHVAIPTAEDKDYPATALPEWLNHKDVAWFRDAHVLTLQVGESAITDFHKITRIV